MAPGMAPEGSWPTLFLPAMHRDPSHVTPEVQPRLFTGCGVRKEMLTWDTCGRGVRVVDGRSRN